ncbi:hypothetical protein BXY66_1935 [Shimia isoporae]|uniref:Uncharacterized protein n=2 Tax=Shimia isoporae TaxID=647720 RepID=A0A4V2Q458_9RHOB|nr:hypothetical protein BXY66_1935 [Shimia isoporae]
MQMSMSFSPEGTLKSEVLLKFEEEGAEIVAELTALSRYEYLPAGILRDRPTDTTLLSLTADGFDIKDLPEARELVDYLLMSSEETYRVDRLTNSELVMSANGESLTCFR